MSKVALLALLTGFIVGLIFGLLRLPIPAPGVWEGITGIIGIYGGFRLAEHLPAIFGKLFG